MEFTQEQKLYAEIVQKAWEDENFKKALVANPIEAIENLTGKKLNLPKGKTLVVRDQTAEDTVYSNIPAAPEVDTELNEEQLEAVSGGTGYIATIVGPWIPILPTFPTGSGEDMQTIR